MRARTVVVSILAVALVIVLGIAVYVSQFDPNQYNQIVADAVKRATGRELTVDGGVELHWFPPAVHVTDIHNSIGNHRCSLECPVFNATLPDHIKLIR